MRTNPARRAGVIFTYLTVTEESAQYGEHDEIGYYYPGGHYDEISKVKDPGEYLIPARSVNEVVNMIREQLGSRPEASVSVFEPGTYYTDSDGDLDYSTGERTYKEAHVEGFTPREEAWIYTALTGRQVMRRNPYPYVSCSRHVGRPQLPGYFVCKHVLAGKPVFQRERARVDDAGVLVCQKCSDEHTLSHAKPVCAYCAADSGWLTVPVARESAKIVNNPAKGGRGPVLSDARRMQINSDLSMRGLDGNGSFRSTSHGISTTFSVLSAYGIQPVDVLSGDLFMGNQGHRAIRVGVRLHEDPFMPPVEFENSLLVFSWYRRQSGSYEILTYMS